MSLDWPSIRETKGECPECAGVRDGFRSKGCVNRHFAGGYACDGETADLSYGAEIPCHESIDEAPCFATGFCGGCGWAFCDEHGASSDVHLWNCTHVKEKR
jgi:hypothetical protein